MTLASLNQQPHRGGELIGQYVDLISRAMSGGVGTERKFNTIVRSLAIVRDDRLVEVSRLLLEKIAKPYGDHDDKLVEHVTDLYEAFFTAEPPVGYRTYRNLIERGRNSNPSVGPRLQALLASEQRFLSGDGEGEPARTGEIIRLAGTVSHSSTESLLHTVVQVADAETKTELADLAASWQACQTGDALDSESLRAAGATARRVIELTTQVILGEKASLSNTTVEHEAIDLALSAARVRCREAALVGLTSDFYHFETPARSTAARSAAWDASLA